MQSVKVTDPIVVVHFNRDSGKAEFAVITPKPELGELSVAELAGLCFAAGQYLLSKLRVNDRDQEVEVDAVLAEAKPEYNPSANCFCGHGLNMHQNGHARCLEMSCTCGQFLPKDSPVLRATCKICGKPLGAHAYREGAVQCP